MLSYYAALGLKSLRQKLGLSVFVLAAIGLGVSSFATALSLFQVVSADPIPWKSDRLYVPVLNSWSTLEGTSASSAPSAMSYPDAVNLLKQKKADFQAAMYQVTAAVTPGVGRPFKADGYAVSSQFFTMFDVPFQYGTGWNEKAEAGRERLVVISHELNEELFGGTNSIGKSVTIGGNDFTVIGVVSSWDPKPRFYDLFGSGGFVASSVRYFVPFEVAAELGIENSGNTVCSEAPVGGGRDCVWVSYMVQINRAPDVASFRTYLDQYSVDVGLVPSKFQGSRLYTLSNWMKLQRVVPSDTVASLFIAIGLLVVCLVNAAAIMLARFMSRAGEVGVRRALGATRSAICFQFLVEAALLGFGGGLLSIGLVIVASNWIKLILPERIATLVHVDLRLLIFALVTAQLSSLVSAAYPAYRAAVVQPAIVIKNG